MLLCTGVVGEKRIADGAGDGELDTLFSLLRGEIVVFALCRHFMTRKDVWSLRWRRNEYVCGSLLC